jgi:hypothetical protein
MSLMQPKWIGIAGLLAALLLGCTTGPAVHSTSWLERLRPYHLPAGPDLVQLDVALLERPLGDPFINEELWVLVDEQAVAMERKVVLEENGFRIGQVGGITPAKLQALLTAEAGRTNRRRHYIHTNDPAVVPLGPAAPNFRFQVRQEATLALVSLERAECVLSIVPSIKSGGVVRLRVTPQIRHGESRLAPAAATDNSGWILQEQRPTESYADLAWEIAVTPGQYLVIGGRPDQPDSLGYQCFFRPDQSVQRLLVIRASRSAPEQDSESEPDSEHPPGQALPLALQAARTTVRGTPR